MTKTNVCTPGRQDAGGEGEDRSIGVGVRLEQGGQGELESGEHGAAVEDLLAPEHADGGRGVVNVNQPLRWIDHPDQLSARVEVFEDLGLDVLDCVRGA